MRIQFRMPSVAVLAALAVTAMIAVGLPASTTAASLTASGSATTSAGMGSWCSVPNPSVSGNVYSLSDFTEIQAPESTTDTGAAKTTVRMLVLPVVNDGSFDPVEPLPAQVGGVDNQLGVRLWSCTPGMSSTQSIKLTAWRGSYTATAASAWVWDVAPTSVSFAQARLNAGANLAINGATTTTTRPGTEVRDAHRGINNLGGQSGANADPVTMRYSWMLTNGRTKNADFTNDPACASKTCHVDGGAGVTNYNNVFSGVDTAAASNAVFQNSTTYLAEKYYSGAGTWPSTTTTTTQLQCSSQTRERIWFWYTDWSAWSAWTDATGTACPANTDLRQYRSQTVPRTVTVDSVPTVTPTVIAPKGSNTNDALLRDTTGTLIQYVVLEWWGTGTPPADLEVEVFVK
ncbi:hypothetical protein IWX78_001756 [Mycetocola sp. CAN_C7]|uniref:hypothetical protein n=1 Tax=Mycetocola sp. CAN_C7 TaxID=2787724 RepID=UPI0018C9EDEB